MNDLGDVHITNNGVNELIINYHTKQINALDVYTMLDYKRGNKYDLDSNKDEIKDNRFNYFNEIIILIKEILDEINLLAPITVVDVDISNSNECSLVNSSEKIVTKM